jgi:hypothetical protein
VLPWAAPAIIWLCVVGQDYQKKTCGKNTKMFVYTKIRRIQAIGNPINSGKKIVITKYYRPFCR